MEEVAKHGNFTHGAGFKSQAWNRILTAYMLKTDDIVTTNQLQSQWNELKKKYDQYQWLLEQSGPGWNAKDQIITTSDDCWKAIFVGKPELKWCKEPNPYINVPCWYNILLPTTNPTTITYILYLTLMHFLILYLYTLLP